VIEISEVRDQDSNRPVAKLSDRPSKVWTKAFESVIAWAKKKGDKPDGLGDPAIPLVVIEGDFKVMQDELRMHVGFGKAWAHVQEFIEDVAIGYANNATG
jgi:hypothetical protein